jgi:hypothetical protein
MRSSASFYRLLFIFVISLCAINGTPTFSQIRCGTVEYMNQLRKEKKIFEADESFEKWIAKRIAARSQKQKLERTEETTYKIPVVVHIIHNGEPVGTGTNLSAAQINSQIAVLNKDFKRLNADAANTPPEFQTVAGSLDIEFVLAKRTSEGLPTDGIVRVKGTKTAWSDSDNTSLKALSYWPAEDYFNIWVCNMPKLLGYTQFPISSTLPGLETASANRLTDGVVIHYKAFGSKADGNFSLLPNYDLGRTATHEVGHFFGLRHIWGDAPSCGGTDYVNDTPNQNGKTEGCPSTTLTACSANQHRMYQNYLDYTDDACMNLFTQGQFDRIVTVLDNSPRRLSLRSSIGWKEPDPVADDLGIRNIISPLENECSASVIPSIEIRNYGTNSITSAEIQLKKNGLIVETKTFSLNLDPLATSTVDFSPTLSNVGTTTTFSFEILHTNGVTDGNNSDNLSSVDVNTLEQISIPFTETFDSAPSGWPIENLDALTTWEVSSAPSDQSGNTAMSVEFYYYEDGEGEKDILYTPIFDLSNETLALLTFDVAYAAFDASSEDGLKVLILTDCNSDLFTATELYNKSGQTLATTANTKQYFKPNGKSQWRKEIIDLSQYIGKSNVRIAFVGVNGWGNNLYLDNISIINQNSFVDIGIDRVINPQIVTCENPAPTLLVQNEGSKTVDGFKVKYSVNGGGYQTTQFTNLSLLPGKQQEVMLPTVSLSKGINTISYVLSEPDSGPDLNSTNDTINTNVVLNAATEIIPFRENFNSPFSDRWSFINPRDGVNWQSINTNYENSVYFNGFNDITLDDEAWLISPLLDFSDLTEASVFFDRSYAYNYKKSTKEELKILASVGCGSTFDINLYDESKYLHNSLSQFAWTPSKAEHWKKIFVDLSELAGQKDVRLAWVVINGHGNNLYIDNIEFFTTADSIPPSITDMFKVYGTTDNTIGFKVTFNLAEQQTVSIDIVDTMGKIILSNTASNVLNQTYPFKLENVSAGLYFVRVRTSTQVKTTKVYIQR